MNYQNLVFHFIPDSNQSDLFRLLIAPTASAATEIPSTHSNLPAFQLPHEAWQKEAQREVSINRIRPVPPLETGQKLWNALPPAAKNAIAAGPRNGARNRETTALRLMISSLSSSICDLPWECLSSPDGPPFGLRTEYRLARAVNLYFVVPSQLVNPRAVIVVSRPQVKAEFDALGHMELIRATMREARIEVATPTTGSVADLARLLNEVQPQIVHFIGHGATSRGEGCLVFEKDGGGSEWITAGTLSKLLPASTGLVCLNTPASVPNYQILGFPRLAKSPSSIRLPTMVVNQFNVSRQTDSTFWQAFYMSLSSKEVNGDINQAVRTAWSKVASLDGTSSREWPAYALFVRDGSGIPFRFLFNMGPMSASFAELKALEIEARLRAQNTNNLAERLRQIGPDAANFLKREIADERLIAAEATNKFHSETGEF